MVLPGAKALGFFNSHKHMKQKNYTGHKLIPGVYQKIINNVPAHDHYYELFCGSGAIFKQLSEIVPPGGAVEYVLNDIDSSVLKKYHSKHPEGVTVRNESAVYVMKTILSMRDKNTFVFLDPPYHHDTRPHCTDIYNYEMTHDDHVQMLMTVLQLKCNVMIIHPKCDLYDTMLKDWRKVELKIRYNDKTSIECLYMNYELAVLQTYRYLGADCWDRQRIKNRKTQMIKKFAKIPEHERRHLLDELTKHFII